MSARAHPGRLAFGLIALAIAAQLPEAWAAPGMRQPFAAGPATDPDARVHQRLIVKLKDADASLDAPLRTRNAQLTISSLGNCIGAGIGAGVEEPASMPMALHRSIRPGLHVATTGHRLKRAEMQQLIRQLEQDPRVEYAEIDERVYPQAIPNDPEFPSQWNLQLPSQATGAANLPGAWDFGLGSTASGQGVVVAVLDTGILEHQDLSDNLIRQSNRLLGYDFVDDPLKANDGDGLDDDPRDPGDWLSEAEALALGCGSDATASSWHGTSVAGTIAAVSNNWVGIAGIAPAARILPVRVFGKCGGYISDVASGIYWSVGLQPPDLPAGSVPRLPEAYRARVINLSLGATEKGQCSNTMREAVQAARGQGAVVIAAAGNRSGDSTALTQPANCTGVIAVTAHTRNGDLADYSNLGGEADLSAPGGGYGRRYLFGDGDLISLLSNTGATVPDRDSLYQNAGTSFAAAHASGVAALLLGLDPLLSPGQVGWLLTSSARAYPSASYCYARSDCGTGLLDAATAVELLQDGQVPATIDEPSVATGGGGGGSSVWYELMLLSAALLARLRRSPKAA